MNGYKLDKEFQKFDENYDEKENIYPLPHHQQKGQPVNIKNNNKQEHWPNETTKLISHKEINKQLDMKLAKSWWEKIKIRIKYKLDL